MGEDLDSLSLKELQNIEQQLDSALKHIRARKVYIYTHIHAFIYLLYVQVWHILIYYIYVC